MKNPKWNHISDPIDALAANILEALDLLGAWHRPVTLRTVVRKMNAYNVPLWEQALNRLVDRKCISIAPGQRRQKLIQIIEVPDDLQPKVVEARPKRERKRGQSKWFKERLQQFRERDGDDPPPEDVEPRWWEYGD